MKSVIVFNFHSANELNRFVAIKSHSFIEINIPYLPIFMVWRIELSLLYHGFIASRTMATTCSLFFSVTICVRMDIATIHVQLNATAEHLIARQAAFREMMHAYKSHVCRSYSFGTRAVRFNNSGKKNWSDTKSTNIQFK